MTDRCLFCRIVSREIEAELVFENDHVLAFNDINPQAPVHVLIIPKEHVPTVNELRPEQSRLMTELLVSAGKIARDQGIAEDGYRLVVNCQEGAGQTVFHLHVHLLGGRKLTWPPG